MFLFICIKFIKIDKGNYVVHVFSADPLHSLAAHWFASASRESLRVRREQGNPALLKQRENGPHDQVVATIKKMPFPLNNREFVGRVVDTNGDLLVVAAPVDDVVDYSMSTRAVRGVPRALKRFTSYGESQCKVTYIQYLDAGGVVPTWIVELKIPLALSAACDLRDEFQREDEIDNMERDDLARVVKDAPQVYTDEENILVDKVHARGLGHLSGNILRSLSRPTTSCAWEKYMLRGVKATLTTPWW